MDVLSTVFGYARRKSYPNTRRFGANCFIHVWAGRIRANGFFESYWTRQFVGGPSGNRGLDWQMDRQMDRLGCFAGWSRYFLWQGKLCLVSTPLFSHHLAHARLFTFMLLNSQLTFRRDRFPSWLQEFRFLDFFLNELPATCEVWAYNLK
jgi:hypothetical protein